MRSSSESLMSSCHHRLQRRLQAVGTTGPRYLRGMTLMELLTVMVVLGILATVSVGSYRRYLVRTNRTDATATLLRVQVAQEKYYLQNSVYTDDLKELGIPETSPGGHYEITIDEPEAGFAVAYLATATAIAGQATSDTQCQSLTINERGQRGSNPGSTDVCWN